MVVVEGGSSAVVVEVVVVVVGIGTLISVNDGKFTITCSKSQSCTYLCHQCDYNSQSQCNGNC